MTTNLNKKSLAHGRKKAPNAAPITNGGGPLEEGRINVSFKNTF